MPSKRPRDEANGIAEAAQLREAATAARDARIARVLKDPENARSLTNTALAARFGCHVETIAAARKRLGAAECEPHPKARRFARVG